MRGILKYWWRVLLAAVLLTGISFLSYGLLARFREFPRPDISHGVLLAWVFLTKLLVTAAMAYPTVRSRWAGTQLMCAIFVAHFGICTFINQSHALLVVPGKISAPAAALLTAHGLLVAVLLSLILVLLMGRVRESGFMVESARLHLPPREWLWKVAVCAAAWVALYLVLPRAADQTPIWQRIAMQTGQALFVVAFVLPVIKMMRGGRLETALAVAVLLAVVGGIEPLLIWRLLLEQAIRPTYALGVVVSSFAYGLLVGYMFSRQAVRV